MAPRKRTRVGAAGGAHFDAGQGAVFALAAAARKARRESGKAGRAARRDRGSRKKPVRRNAASTSSGLGPGPSPPRRKAGKGSRLFAPRFAGGGADGAAAFGRNVDQIVARSGRRAALEIERETAVGQHLRLETGDQRAARVRRRRAGRRSGSTPRTAIRGGRAPAAGAIRAPSQPTPARPSALSISRPARSVRGSMA